MVADSQPITQPPKTKKYLSLPFLTEATIRMTAQTRKQAMLYVV
jgi:hypothetical protein